MFCCFLFVLPDWCIDDMSAIYRKTISEMRVTEVVEREKQSMVTTKMRKKTTKKLEMKLGVWMTDAGKKVMMML